VIWALATLVLCSLAFVLGWFLRACFDGVRFFGEH
jgi:hypothetical protein